VSWDRARNRLAAYSAEPFLNETTMSGRTKIAVGEATAATATAAARRGPGRKRDEATRQAILRAAYETLEAEGYGGFTIEAVATRSGAAKTTIYRWWPSKGALAIDSFLDLYKREAPFPRTRSASEDLKAHRMRVQRDTEAASIVRGRVRSAAGWNTMKSRQE
jgi:AcrR family transcriptional regulator